jgi:membrane associated rhomboid family serine protease
MTMRMDQVSPVPPLTKVTKWIIITCVVTYFIDFFFYHMGVRFNGLTLSQVFGLVPVAVTEKFWLWQFVTYSFFHGSALHLLLNMLILWFFGSEIEMRMGEGRFFRFFLLCGVGAALFNYSINIAFGDPMKLTHPIIGASGAIYGVLAAYGIFFSERYFLVFFLFPMKAKYFVLVMAAIELVMGVEANPGDNVAHFAHIGGMIIGAIYVYFMYVRTSGQKKNGKKDAERERLKKQFTLIVNDPQKKSEEDEKKFWN